ncbi:hypothetical protein [Streptomyces cinereoruber]|uniref:hypothetical protein n=1 Tax=Streptomyces cinereoruber TaxID=67260 RepID=UPI0012668EF8|nr:hypothetical protein [Streptomyces cinereoruber]MBB4161642.1 hypothetical protein [Streptomyces cinereoruber]MBY8820426.1 hypothetical protein [Streptomyces cinereoruber]NIH65505.1 hypothetical protein [Streptomyces cinereoruber]
MIATGYGDVTVVVDEEDDLFYTQAALAAHCPGRGRITVHPTPASGHPAALAHDMLYALGKRLAPGPHSPDGWLDSVGEAWRAAAAWAQATAVRHVLVSRVHLLTPRRIDQLLAWRTTTGVQLTLLWQGKECKLPPVLGGVERRLRGRDSFEALLAEPGPIPARPSFSPGEPIACRPGVTAVAGVSRRSSARLVRGPASAGRGRPAADCGGVAAYLGHVVPAIAVGGQSTAIVSALAHPLAAGALSVLAFTRVGLGSLRWTREVDITGDVSAIKVHGVAHRSCAVYTVPDWARPLLAAAQAHHRLGSHRTGEGVFAPVLRAEARHLRTHAARLPRLGLTVLADNLVP